MAITLVTSLWVPQNLAFPDVTNSIYPNLYISLHRHPSHSSNQQQQFLFAFIQPYNRYLPIGSSESTADAKADSNNTNNTKPDAAANATASKPLAPPPKPGQTNTPDFFAGQVGGSLSLEPNPFEQSFGGGGPETPGGTKLPSVAALTSPSSLLPGQTSTPFAWGGGSLRTGPLSPAMLSGPTNDYFSESHGLRGGFPTPNESGLRSGLTPGGSGSMFPAQSPNSQALFAQLASGGATPSTLDFHRTAMSAAAKQANTSQPGQQPQTQQQQQQQQPITSQPQEMAGGATVKTESKPASGPFDPHDNDAANGLFMLAQGRNQGGNQFNTGANNAAGNQANMNADSTKANGAGRGGSESGNGSEEQESAKPNTRGKGKKGQATNARRKAEEPPAKAPPSKKAKANPPPPPSDEQSDDDNDDEKLDENGNKVKMTDEEKRKNFLERNR